MDPVSLTAGIIAFLQATQVVIQRAQDIKDAPKDRRFLRQEANDLHRLLSIWVRHLDEAKRHPNDQWYQNILGLAASEPGTFTKDGKFITEQDQKRVAGRKSRRPLLARSSSSSGQAQHVKKDQSGADAPSPSNIFTRLASLREELEEKTKTPTGIKRYTYRMTWSASKASYVQLRDSMRGLKDLLDSILMQSNFDVSVDTNSEVKEIRREQTKVRAQKEKEDRGKKLKEIMAWLSPLEFYEVERRIFDDSYRHAGRWLIDHPVFKGWQSGLPSELFCWGAPGSGKTVLSSIVLNHLRNEYEEGVNGDVKPADQRAAVFSVFIKHKGKDQSVRNVYASLVKQMMAFQKDTFDLDSILPIFNRAGGIARPSEEELKPILHKAISKLKRVFIIVDALDEWSDTMTARLMKLLRDPPIPNVSLMFTSRPIGDETLIRCDCDHCDQPRKKTVFWKYEEPDGNKIDICEGCRVKNCHNNLEPDRRVEVQIETPSGEIEDFVRWVMEKELGYILARADEVDINYGGIGSTRLGRNLKRDVELQREIPRAISGRAKNRFLLAKLYTDKLLKQQSVEAVRETLRNLPEKLDELYAEIIQQRIIENDNKEDARLGMQVLSWISYQYRPMTIMELQQAIAVRVWDEEQDLRRGYEIDEQIILEATAGLISVDHDKTVSFHHLTAQEYFLRTRKRWFPDAESEIAMAILAYLRYDEFSKSFHGDNGKADLGTRLKRYPFLAYASQHWGSHLKTLGFEGEKGRAIRERSVLLLMDEDRLASITQADSASWDVQAGVNGIQMCGRFGLTELVPDLLQRGLSVDDSDPSYKQTALMYACRWGHKEVVTKLLEANANVDACSVRGTTPLLEAIEHDHHVIVGILQRNNADVNQNYLSRLNRTALLIVVSVDGVISVKHLLQRHDIDVNAQDSKGYTALILAAKRGNVAIVNLLLEHPDINVDLSDQRGRTALSFAAEEGSEANVKNLLDHKADPTIKSLIRGSNAAIIAAQCNNTAAIETLLETYPTLISSSDDYGRSLLHYAASEDAVETAEILMASGISINAPCKQHGETPLHEACRYGNVETAHLLLDGGADPSIKDIHQRTPYLIAWQHGRTHIMKLLSSRISSQEPLPSPSSLPTWAMVSQNRPDLLRTRLAQSPNSLIDDLDPDNGYTAFHIAVTLGNTPSSLDLLNLLLDASPSPPNPADNYGRTPLHLAAETNNVPAAAALLVHGVALEIRNTWGSTPLAVTQAHESWDVALLLVEKGAVVDLQAHPIQLLFFAAVEAGRAEATRRLMEQGADVELARWDGQKAEDVVRLASYEDAIKKELLLVLRGA
ncbi:MAG: hypothetical protein M1816_003882 [Peltula sp. TS41687]|nr:MAG: hypothetical protein M1816_003882 [Peltula sp. TS41687]